MKVPVVAYSNRRPVEPYYILDKFLASLRRLGAEVVILGEGKPWNGLMTKPLGLREWVRANVNKHPFSIFSDSWDVVFAKSPEEILEKYKSIPEFEGAVVFGTEINCFPRAELASLYPNDSKWRFLNAGFFMGPTRGIGEILESMHLDSLPHDMRLPNGNWFHPNDQEYYQFEYFKQPVKIVLDTQCRLVQNCHGLEPSELEIEGQRIRNKITGSEPGVFHFNGGAKNQIMPLVLKTLGL